MRLTNREKEIVSATYPCYGRFATKEEVKAAKLKARGHYWHDPEFHQFCAMSPNGKREYFDYCHHPNEKDYKTCCSKGEFNYQEMRKAARNWAKGEL